MYRFLLKPVSFSPQKVLQVPVLELRAGGNHGVLDLIDLILDVRFEILVEDRVAQRVVLLAGGPRGRGRRD